jgi:alcohol dehydrogenase
MYLLCEKNSIKRLRDILVGCRAGRVFIVTGGKSFENSGAKDYIDTLSREFLFFRFSGFGSNPDLADVITGIGHFLAFNPDIVLAIGGGSSIDMAKSINALADTHVNDYRTIISENRPVTPRLPLIAIPTTTGSGAEATHFAVLYIDKIKYSIAHDRLRPGYVLLDPGLCRSQTAYQRAVSGIDAFSQAIESYWSIHSTSKSRWYSLKALEHLRDNLPLVINTGENDELQKVLEGAHMAGKAINIARTTAPHAFSYGLSTGFGLPHGHAVALTLPYFIRYNSSVNKFNCADKRGHEWVRSRIKEIADLLNVTSAGLPGRVHSFIAGLGLETGFSRLMISRDDFVQAAKSLNIQRLSNNPVRFDLHKIKEIYEFSRHDVS